MAHIRGPSRGGRPFSPRGGRLPFPVGGKLLELFGGDGSRGAQGDLVLGVEAEKRGARLERDGFCGVRFTFPDGSIITQPDAGAWDLGYPDCWCWEGVGHTEACEAGE